MKSGASSQLCSMTSKFSGDASTHLGCRLLWYFAVIGLCNYRHGHIYCMLIAHIYATCMLTCMHAHKYACSHSHICVFICTCVLICIHDQIYACSVAHIYACSHIYAMHIYVIMYAHVYENYACSHICSISFRLSTRPSAVADMLLTGACFENAFEFRKSLKCDCWCAISWGRPDLRSRARNLARLWIYTWKQIPSAPQNLQICDQSSPVGPFEPCMDSSAVLSMMFYVICLKV